MKNGCLSLLLLLGGCLHQLDPVLARHTMAIDAHGKLAKKQIAPPCPGAEAEAGDHSPERAQAAVIAKAYRNSGRSKILIYLHGGLVSLRSSAKESEVLLPKMEADGYFPIFINWDTSFFRSYGGHLVHKPNGYPGRRGSWALSPFRLVLDVVEGVAATPRSWGAAGLNAVQSNYLWHRRRDAVLMENLHLCDGSGRGLACFDEGRPSTMNVLGRGAQWIVQFPFKLFFTPLVYTGGAAAWNDMLRRTRIIFERDTEFFRQRRPDPSEPSGALPQLLRELEAVGDGQNPLRITIVAHSMGAIVSNAILNRFRANQNVIVERIVYLGAAANIADSFDALVPYLQVHPTTEFFNVMLHPLAEDRERSAIGFAPDGSLLAWVDGMYQHPHSFLERTFGRWSNVKPALHLLPAGESSTDVRPRMHFHVLGFGKSPETHGALNDIHWHFWREEFYLGTQSSRAP
ncbi:MAG: hypothetical protein JWN48_4267 [Myxococcaceae bacterium]|nr:hypothetical protein [Myxococcaceae bacterium]